MSVILFLPSRYEVTNEAKGRYKKPVDNGLESDRINKPSLETDKPTSEEVKIGGQVFCPQNRDETSDKAEFWR